MSRLVHFVCPKCESNSLEELTRGIKYYSIDGFYNGFQQYGNDGEYEEEEVVRYSCYDCGERIIEGHCSDLYTKLLELGYLDIKEDVPNWEV